MVQTNAKFSIVVVYMSIGMFGRTGWLHAAAYQANATCSEDWSWMNNQNGSSPCLTAAAISQPCFSDGRNPLNFRTFTYSLSSKTSKSCPLALMRSIRRQACLTITNATGMLSSFVADLHISHFWYSSWAVYNLIQACTICQGLYDAVLTYAWPLLSLSCLKP